MIACQWRKRIITGAFHLVKISGISGSAVNGTRFVGSSHWKIPRKSGKSKKVGPFSRLEFPNGMSCSIYVFRSLNQFQVHGRAPRPTGVYDQMEQLLPIGNSTFSPTEISGVFFLNGKHPTPRPNTARGAPKVPFSKLYGTLQDTYSSGDFCPLIP